MAWKTLDDVDLAGKVVLVEKDPRFLPLLAELDDIETRVGRITVPLSYADELYSLRGHIEMVRQRLRGAADTDSAA